MKKARIILIALILFAGIGGGFAFNVSRFNLNPVLTTTDIIYTTVGGTSFYATTDPVIAGFCIRAPFLYWSTTGLSIDAFVTIPVWITVTFTSVGGTSTITRVLQRCIEIDGLANTVI
jgi:hypothetical protein